MTCTLDWEDQESLETNSQQNSMRLIAGNSTGNSALKGPKISDRI